MEQQIVLPRLHCKRCEYDWTPRVPNPAICPRCKHRDWNEDKPTEVNDNVEEKQSQSVSQHQ